MRLWQSAMISLAKSEKVTAAMQSSAFMQRFASQFVGGTNGSQALDTVARLRERGIRTSVFCLGEYVRDADLVEQCVLDLLHIVPKLSEVGLDTHVSIDPTQMGASIDWTLCAANVKRVVDCVAQLITTPQRKVLMLDMEDSSITDATLNLWNTLHSNGYPVAITIQAYLRRSERDIRRLVEAGATVRLVKGALAEKADVAFRMRSDIDANYRALTEMLLGADAKTQGVYPAFGTHDERMIAHATERAKSNGWTHEQWEIEMLYGVRDALQRDLVAQGHRLRLYMPFGKNFWPYCVRRIGESPHNLQFVLRAMLEVNHRHWK